jgi:hypothetical protein
MPKKNVRVTIPTDPSEDIALLVKVKAKHDALGDASPLKGLKWEKIGPAYASAKLHDDAAEDAKKVMEREFRARDVDMPTVMQALRDSRDVLLAVNSENPKVLGDYGFEVDDSPRAATTAAPATAAAATPAK